MAKKEKKLCPICKKVWCYSDIWCADCYYDFVKAHKFIVIGQDAIKLKKQLDSSIPYPRVKRRLSLTT